MEIADAVKTHALTLAARLRNEAFNCRALAGESHYNICINADLTVSCNCQDYSGQGHIGDLNEQTLEQIFSGKTALAFRTMLAAGKLPTDQCLNCPELRRIPRRDCAQHLTGFSLPHQGIMVENCALCNLHCPMCKRLKLLNIRKQHTMSLKDVEKVAGILKQYSIERVYYFNLGEPFLPADIGAQARIIRETNPDIRMITSTNGLLLDSDEKLAAAMEMDYIFISLDGIDQAMVSRYQIGDDFAQVYANMKRLTALRNRIGRKRDGISLPIIEWRYIMFRWNDKPEHFHKAVELAKNAAVDILVFSPGAAHFSKRSYRYTYHPFFRKLRREHSSGDILVNLGGIPEHLISP